MVVIRGVGTIGLYPRESCVHRAGRNLASAQSRLERGNFLKRWWTHLVNGAKTEVVSKCVTLWCSRVALPCHCDLFHVV